MDETDVRQAWEANAEAWTVMSRAGYDISRDQFNTPAFLEMLGSVQGLVGLDIGCGEGHNTRLLAARGARMTGIDIADTFIRHAKSAEAEQPLDIAYHVASATSLPFADAQFDFATAFMCFQDVWNQQQALAEAFRVVKPGGFFQFSITHPCFQIPNSRWLRDDSGRRVAKAISDYFERVDCHVEEWTFGAAPREISGRYPKFRVLYFERTLASWLNLILQTGFELDRFAEPTPSDEALARYPSLYDARLIAYFLIIRCRKPSRSGFPTRPSSPKSA